MTLTQLEYVLALEKYQNYVRAADACSVTQPALTLQVKNLENELGFMLFDRTKKPVKLTEPGKAFLEQARVILLEVKKANDIAEYQRNTSDGKLKIGIIPTLAPYLLPTFISELNESNPGIKLQVIEEMTSEIVKALKAGELDAGIIATPIKAPGLISFPLFYEKFYLYVSESHPFYNNGKIELGKLKEVDIWLLKEGNCFRNQVGNFCAYGSGNEPKDNFSFESSSIESLMRIVEHRQGLTFIPELATLGIPTDKEDMVKGIVGGEPVREISLVVTRTFVKKHLIDKVMEHIQNNIPKRMLTKPDNAILDTGLNLG
ncbi:LysR substrate-binding domain-containing protein [Flammeovirgaceae bacterium SG7u.111]|nr:LysR substrate-binding domain-containing protein [Flammeovirgaceae bacterium SG7u.132]WPO37950.1 LysR substrate-binding domain-containing protein [Flammeovirgaceae bacterium SG7u.111]